MKCQSDYQRRLQICPVVIAGCTHSGHAGRTALQKFAYPEWGEYPSDEMIVKAVVKIARAALKGKP
jgi:hypothetical protein